MASRAIKRANIILSIRRRRLFAVAAVAFRVHRRLCWGIWSVGSSWLSDLPDYYKSADAYNTAQPTVVYASDEDGARGVPAGEPRPGRNQRHQRLRAQGHGGYGGRAILLPWCNRSLGHRPRLWSSTSWAATARAHPPSRSNSCATTILSSEMDDISIKRKVH